MFTARGMQISACNVLHHVHRNDEVSLQLHSNLSADLKGCSGYLVPHFHKSGGL